MQKHQDLLEVHLQKLIGPFDEKGGAHVEVEVREAVFFGLGRGLLLVGVAEGQVAGTKRPYQVSVPHPNSTLHIKFPHK